MRGLGRAGLAGALARVGTNLVQLELRQFAVDGEFGDALLAATYPRLADLHLDEEMVSEQGIRHLIDATVTPALERLSLDSLAMISGSSWPSALLRRSTESAATARGAWLRCSVCCAKIRAESRGRGCTWVGRSTDWCAARLFWVRCCEGSLILGEGSLPPSLVGFSCRSDGRGHGPLLQPLRSIDIAPDVTDLRELARLDLEERRACEACEAAVDLGLADTGRASMMMFFGAISSRRSPPTCWRRRRLRIATAPARFAGFCPTI